MPRRNRVDPFGRIVAYAARGLLMGNRGCLHDKDGHITRASARPAWISCQPTWPGVRRSLMQPGHYTELFFLDEATAMAAGHRPCGSCRPDALAAFKAAWQQAFGLPHLPRVGEIDAALRSTGSDRLDVLDATIDGAMIAGDGQPRLCWAGGWRGWTPFGYEELAADLPGDRTILTSAPMLAVLRAGYRPLVHATADQACLMPLAACVSATVSP